MTIHPRTLAALIALGVLVAALAGWQPPQAVYVGLGITVGVSIIGAWLWNRRL